MDVDVLIVGAGIAGASLAWWLAPHRRVALLESESQPGYHATGRSAAMFMESYGPPGVRALTRASRGFYLAPPAGFTDRPLVTPRGALYVAAPGQGEALDALQAELAPGCPGLQRLDAVATRQRVPCLREDQVIGALLDPDAMDLDVHALHQGFLRGARRAGATLLTDAELVRAEPGDAQWTVTTAAGTALRAAVLVNAAGAWADAVARRCGVRPVGLQPCRRSAFVFQPPAGLPIHDWPVVAGVDEGWYFKPDAGRLLGSPANADPVEPQDVQPEELDIATGIARIEAATTLQIRRPERTWAGLRTFAPDGEPVIGFDPAQPRFFWLAGQGGYGIQSAAGAGALAEALLRGPDLPGPLQAAGVDPAVFAPGRAPANRL